MFNQATTEFYRPLESVYREDLEKVQVRPFVTLGKNVHSSFIINCGILIHVPGERAWHPLQENEAILTKITI